MTQHPAPNSATDPIQQALWFIESHYASDISLSDIARVAGVSRFHLTRAFGAVTGRSIMRYVRGRRLSIAARELVGAGRTILEVALDAGYQSHEAFTRAFKDEFDITPDALRAQGHLAALSLLEPIKMNETPSRSLKTPRFEVGNTLLIAGLSERYSYEASAAIPAQWQRFAPHIGHVPGQIGNVSYGVCCNSDEAGNIDYVSGVEVSEFSKIAPPLTRLRIPEHRYAVFSHDGHIASIRQTWSAIFSEWLPASGLTLADAPQFERYDSRFDPATGLGGFEIWIPIA